MKKCVLLFFISSEAKILFLAIHAGEKKNYVKNKRHFSVSLSILTGSLPSVLGWLVAIFFLYVCLSWLSTFEQET